MSDELGRELGLGIGSCDPIGIVTVGGTSLVGRLIPAVPLQLGSRSYSWGVYSGPMTDRLILGFDFLSTYKCIIDLDSNFLVVWGGRLAGPVSTAWGVPSVAGETSRPLPL